MVDVSIDGQDVVFTVKGLHKFWALKHQIRVPRSHIRAVRAVTAATRSGPSGLRLPGTYVPGVITAGSYRATGGRWSFWDVVRDARAIVVELADERYTELVIEVANPAAAIALVEQARTAAA